LIDFSMLIGLFVEFLLILGRVRNGLWDCRFSVKPFWIYVFIGFLEWGILT
jgi:hypothetical protein